VTAVDDHLHDVEGARFAWREAGVGPATIVCFHGLGGSRLSWNRLLHDLAPLARVAAWDMPGYGASPPLDGDLTFTALADAAADFVEWLTGPGGRAHVVGLSLGGMVGQYLAALHPERVASLHLLSTSPKFGLDGSKAEAWRAGRLAPLDAGEEPAQFADRVLRNIAGPHITADALEEQKAAMARISGPALRRMIDCIVTHDARPLLARIAAPTQVLVGTEDRETPVQYAEYLARHIPGAELHVIEGMGHLLNAEAPDDVARLIGDLVSRVESHASR
jgi:3-oxoadipate enol-lactonase